MRVPACERRNWPRAPRGRAEQGAASLVAVMAMSLAALLIGVALLSMGVGESDVVEYRADSTRALWLAEGGIERARVWLSKLYESNPALDPTGLGAQQQTLGGGQYGYTVTGMSSGPLGLPLFTVVSTGQVDRAVRQVRVVLTPETFAHYQWLVNSQAPDTWFMTGDYFEGPVHMNGHLRIDGDPWFGARVTASGSYIEAPNSNPTFTAGYQIGVPQVPLPNYNALNQTLRAEAMNGGLHRPSLPGNSSYCEVVLGRGGAAGTLSYRSYSGGTFSGWTDVLLRNLNGAAWFDSPVWIQGTIDGQLTLGCSKEIWITDDLLFAASTPGQGPDPGCDDLLGLVAVEDIYIKDTVPNGTDCELHGIFMSLNRRFQVEGWNNPPARGTLTIWGGIIADQAWRVGTWVQGVARSGYDRNWHYDPRMLQLFPPFFPLTGDMMIVSWAEVIPPEV